MYLITGAGAIQSIRAGAQVSSSAKETCSIIGAGSEEVLADAGATCSFSCWRWTGDIRCGRHVLDKHQRFQEVGKHRYGCHILEHRRLLSISHSSLRHSVGRSRLLLCRVMARRQCDHPDSHEVMLPKTAVSTFSPSLRCTSSDITWSCSNGHNKTCATHLSKNTWFHV